MSRRRRRGQPKFDDDLTRPTPDEYLDPVRPPTTPPPDAEELRRRRAWEIAETIRKRDERKKR